MSKPSVEVLAPLAGPTWPPAEAEVGERRGAAPAGVGRGRGA
jgi:hypothetical protein